eukprot:354583-Chlamydomonas_euryale.AAC.2
MDQMGATRSYPSSTIARCRRERKAQGPEKGQTTTGNGHEGCRTEWGRTGGSKTHRREKENREGLERNLRRKSRKDWKGGESEDKKGAKAQEGKVALAGGAGRAPQARHEQA